MKKMNIYKIERTDIPGWDEYIGAVVVANSEDEARRMHPDDTLVNKDGVWRNKKNGEECPHRWNDWAELSNIDVQLIGIADNKYTESIVIMSSYNAG